VTLAQAFALITIVGSLLAYAGLAVWTWKTPDGMTFRYFCLVATLEAARCAGWLLRALQTWESYSHPDAVLISIMVCQVAASVFTCLLALSFQRAIQEPRSRAR
jgi:hypothetical protein